MYVLISLIYNKTKTVECAKFNGSTNSRHVRLNTHAVSKQNYIKSLELLKSLTKGLPCVLVWLRSSSQGAVAFGWKLFKTIVLANKGKAKFFVGFLYFLSYLLNNWHETRQMVNKPNSYLIQRLQYQKRPGIAD